MALAPGTTVVAAIDLGRLFTDGLVAALAPHLPEFQVVLLESASSLAALNIDHKLVGLILVCVGRKSITSLEVKRELSGITSNFPNVPMAVLADGESLDEIRSALQLGAKGYIPNSLAAHITSGVLRLLSAGGSYAPLTAFWRVPTGHPQRVTSEIPPETTLPDFTPRQRAILKCLHAGMSNKLIAYELDMCENTVKVHMRNIMRKVGASNRTQIVTMTRNVFG